MVYITGDCHGDFTRFSTSRFPEQKEMTRKDIMIILGDFGLWHNDPQERYWLDWLGDKPFTIVWVDGNHENFDRLYGGEFYEYSFHEGKAHEIRRNIYHLKRGEVFEFDGKKFWAFGGAKSHDIQGGVYEPNDKDGISKVKKMGKPFRINHVSWWEQEMPSDEEKFSGKWNLAGCGDHVDYIITHCCPQSIATYMGFYGADSLTMYFEDIAFNAKYDQWWFGHYHRDEDIFGKFHCRFEKIERLL